MAKARKAGRRRATRADAVKKPALPARPSRTRVKSSLTPLEVMLGAMRELWLRAAKLKGKPDCEEERLALIRQASAEAHKAAVYVHPRLASIGPGEEDEGGQAQARTSDALTGETPPLLGSRELARRLLFAVAVAEHLSIDRISEEKP